MAPIRTIVQQFDGSSELLDAQREVVETLALLAQVQADSFANEIRLLLAGAGTGVDQTIKISKIVEQQTQSRAYSSTSSNDIAENVGTVIGDFLEGDTNSIINGIKTIISSALGTLFGESTGASNSIKDYFVYCTPYMIYRVDWMAWYRSVTARAIQTKMEKVTSFAYALSNVDVKALEWGDFIGIYGLQLQAENLTAEQIRQARVDMRDTWNFMTGEEATLDDDPLASAPQGITQPHGESLALIGAAQPAPH